VSQLQILMPMGGLGSRFTDKGYATPKPLIPVDGKPMFIKALDSFSTIKNPSYIFVVRKEHIEKYSIDKQIKEHLPAAKIITLDHDTRGAVETCLVAKDLIDDSIPLVIADCDIYFESSEYFKKIEQNEVDGLLLTFNSSDPRYSYVELNNQGYAIRTAEKIVISDNAILGGYFFKTGRLFKEVAQEFVDNTLPKELKEYFVSHLFNMLIDKAHIVETAKVDTVHIFGTPEELEAYSNRSGDKNEDN